MKLFGSARRKLETSHQLVKEISGDICIEIGLGKCKDTFEKGRLTDTPWIAINLNTFIHCLYFIELFTYGNYLKIN